MVTADDDVDDVDTKMNAISLTVETKLKEGVSQSELWTYTGGSCTVR